jgi:hypothetical protein
VARRDQPQLAILIDHIGFGRGHVNHVGLRPDAVGHILDVEACLSRHEFRHQAFVVRRHMLHDHVSHIQIGWQRRDKFPDRFQAAR